MTNQIDIEIRKLEPSNISEFILVINLFEDVFEMENFSIPKTSYLQKLLEKDSFYVFAAFSGQRVVGGLTSYVLDQYYSEKPLAYIFDLAVDTEMQRKGVGKELIKYTKQYFRMRGFEEVFVQADQIDQNAVSFYRSTKPTEEEKVAHFYYTLSRS